MTNDKEVAAFIKKKGAVQWREVQAFMAGVDESKPAVEPAEVAACLGRLLSSGQLGTPWTTMKVPYVWYRHTDTKFAPAGKLRQASRKKYPHLWPVTARVERARLRRENKRVEEQELLDAIFTCIETQGPISLPDLCEEFELGPDAMRRRLEILSEYSIERREEPTGGRGRPFYVWYVDESNFIPDGDDPPPDDGVGEDPADTGEVSSKVEIKWEDDT